MDETPVFFNPEINGVIAKKGGTTSHGAILCKAREIPFVITDDVNFDESSNVVIDTRDKIVYSNCSEEFIEKYKKYKKSISQHVRLC